MRISTIGTGNDIASFALQAVWVFGGWFHNPERYHSQSAREYGLIIHSEVSIGYDVPWRKTHQLLIEAALNTPGVIDDPRPFILETSLQDYYPVYQVNAYIRDANSLSQIYSDLHQNIQDAFNEAGIEIMSPHYIATRDGSETTIPKDDLREKKQ